jgi:hypothetical protein
MTRLMAARALGPSMLAKLEKLAFEIMLRPANFPALNPLVTQQPDDTG